MIIVLDLFGCCGLKSFKNKNSHICVDSECAPCEWMRISICEFKLMALHEANERLLLFARCERQSHVARYGSSSINSNVYSLRIAHTKNKQNSLLWFEFLHIIGDEQIHYEDRTSSHYRIAHTTYMLWKLWQDKVFRAYTLPLRE